MPQYKFPTVEEIIDVNRRVLAEIPVKKADRHQGLVTKEIATNS
jgi:ribosomal protein L20